MNVGIRTVAVQFFFLGIFVSILCLCSADSLEELGGHKLKKKGFLYWIHWKWVVPTENQPGRRVVRRMSCMVLFSRLFQHDNVQHDNADVGETSKPYFGIN
jgi:hypothetical protein